MANKPIIHIPFDQEELLIIIEALDAMSEGEDNDVMELQLRISEEYAELAKETKSRN